MSKRKQQHHDINNQSYDNALNKNDNNPELTAKVNNEQMPDTSDNVEKSKEQFDSPDIHAKCKEREKELLDQLLRARADYENFHKRTMKEKEEIRFLGNCDILVSLMPFFDSLDKAFEFHQELAPLKSQLNSIIQKIGLQEIVPVIEKDKADHAKHEIISTVPTGDKQKDGLISSVISKGYMFKDKIIRYPCVSVYKFNNNNQQKLVNQDVSCDEKNDVNKEIKKEKDEKEGG